MRTWDSAEHRPAEVALPFSASEAALELRCLAGASHVHVVLSDDDGVKLRAEVTAEPGETVPLHFERDGSGTYSLWSQGRDVVHLPCDARYDPLPPIRPAASPAPLDVTIVVDATTRVWLPSPPARRLLDAHELWSAHVEKLVEFATRAGEGRDARIAMIAFGDQQPPAVTAPDLQPRYVLHPSEEQRVLQPFIGERLRDALLSLAASNGADFVDATADALDACARLHWREEARKLVVLTGDSPGASLLYPLPRGADLCVRELDVDTRVLALHRLGVEVLTIHHAPRNSPLHSLPFQRALLAGARAQYGRLASLPEFALDETSFDSAAAAERFQRAAGSIARGAALGELARITGAATSPKRSRAARAR
ncbi:MAG TPA: hypothetical protein VGF69_17175 [Thermoanaerobaculia bacterium]